MDFDSFPHLRRCYIFHFKQLLLGNVIFVPIIAIIARNSRETLVLALSKKVYTTIPLQAEPKALAWALTVAIDLNLERVYFESDSKICVDTPQMLFMWFIWFRFWAFLFFVSLFRRSEVRSLLVSLYFCFY